MELKEVKEKMQKGMYVEEPITIFPFSKRRREYFNKVMNEGYLSILRNASLGGIGYCPECASVAYHIYAVTTDLRGEGELFRFKNGGARRYFTKFAFCKKCGFVNDYKDFIWHGSTH